MTFSTDYRQALRKVLSISASKFLLEQRSSNVDGECSNSMSIFWRNDNFVGSAFALDVFFIIQIFEKTKITMKCWWESFTFHKQKYWYHYRLLLHWVHVSSITFFYIFLFCFLVYIHLFSRLRNQARFIDFISFLTDW